MTRLPHNYHKVACKNIFGRTYYVKNKSDRFIPLFILIGVVCGTAAIPKTFQLIKPTMVFAPVVNAQEVAVNETGHTPATIEPPKYKLAKVTAYSCGGLKTEAEIDMNCPSIRKYPRGRTNSGTTPRPYRTVACDRANLGKRFILDGIGEVTCEDTGGAIKGAGRFDVYLPTVQEAREFGVQELLYREDV